MMKMKSVIFVRLPKRSLPGADCAIMKRKNKKVDIYQFTE